MKQLLFFLFVCFFVLSSFCTDVQGDTIAKSVCFTMCKLEELNYCGTSSKTLAKVKNHYHRTFPRTFLENCFLELFDYCNVSVVFN